MNKEKIFFALIAISYALGSSFALNAKNFCSFYLL